MNKILMRAILDAAAFLALSGDDVVDQDSAVAELESIGEVLSGLSHADRDELTRFAGQIAAEEEKSGAETTRVSFFKDFASNIGLTE